MKILIIGSGARENALATAIMRSPQPIQLYNIGSHINPGIAALAVELQVLALNNLSAMVQAATQWAIDLAVIGPEQPLEAGLADAFEQAGITVIGPTQALAQLETSKGYTRSLLQKYQIAGSIGFKHFTSLEGAADYLQMLGDGYVIKADGLMGGKGVKLAGEHLSSHAEALQFCREILNLGQGFVIEEKMLGEEFSLLGFYDGQTLIPMPLLQDHKRAFNGDHGPNTGGMGTYSDAAHLLPFVDEADCRAAVRITEAALKAAQQDVQARYVGIIYGSFMKTAQGIRLIEFNVRFGDPEAINLMALLETDLVEIFQAMIQGRLAQIHIQFQAKASVCKYLVPEGYPDHPLKNVNIQVPSLHSTEVALYFASVKAIGLNEYQLLGSRAIALVALADTIASASMQIEEIATQISGPVFHRSDIGTPESIQRRIDKVKALCQN